MKSIYEGLICNLKNKLENKNIKFNDFLSLINDKTIQRLIENIFNLKKKLKNKLKNKNIKFNDFLSLINDETNQRLIENIYNLKKKLKNNLENKLKK